MTLMKIKTGHTLCEDYGGNIKLANEIDKQFRYILSLLKPIDEVLHSDCHGIGYMNRVFVNVEPFKKMVQELKTRLKDE